MRCPLTFSGLQGILAGSRSKGGTRSDQPFVPMLQLAAEKNDALVNSYAPATLLSYCRSLQAFLVFLQAHNLNPHPPIDPEDIASFLAYLKVTENSYSRMTSFMTAISWRHKTLNLSDPSKNYNLSRMLSRYKKNAPAVKRAAPLTLGHLEACLNEILKLSLPVYEATMLRAILLTCYYGCMRIGELCFSGNRNNILKTRAAEFVKTKDTKYFKFTLAQFKHSKEPATLAFAANPSSSHCPVAALEDYLSRRPGNAEFFFATQLGSSVKRAWVADNLKKLIRLAGFKGDAFTTHSLRAGRATDLAEAGVSDAQIRVAGRWRSDAYKVYLRFEVIPPPSSETRHCVLSALLGQ